MIECFGDEASYVATYEPGIAPMWLPSPFAEQPRPSISKYPI